MLAYRIGHRNYVSSLTASGIEGRWASAGKMVIYCADSIALAFLENMVRRQGVGFNKDFKIVIIDIPDKLTIEEITINELDKGWRDCKDYSICQQLGNDWYREMRTPVLKVPSAVLPQNNNLVLNTSHRDFKRIRIAGITDLVPDERIETILKNYKH